MLPGEDGRGGGPDRIEPRGSSITACTLNFEVTRSDHVGAGTR